MHYSVTLCMHSKDKSYEGGSFLRYTAPPDGLSKALGWLHLPRHSLGGSKSASFTKWWLKIIENYNF